jgi:hypothetical protein
MNFFQQNAPARIPPIFVLSRIEFILVRLRARLDEGRGWIPQWKVGNGGNAWQLVARVLFARSCPTLILIRYVIDAL